MSFKQFVDKEFPVYWLPGQTLNEGTNQYDFDAAEIPNNPTMHIPKVGRFIYTYGPTDDIAALWCGKKAKDCSGPPGGGTTNVCNQCVEVQHGAYFPGTGIRYEGAIEGWPGPIFSLPGFTGRNYCRIPAPPGFESDISICSLPFKVYDGATVLYAGTVGTYNYPIQDKPPPFWPSIYGAACCFPSPPPPPPPPPGGGGCGTPS